MPRPRQRLATLVLLLATCSAFLSGTQAPAPSPPTAPPPATQSPQPAQPAAAIDFDAPLPLDPAVRRVVLDNGLTVYLRRNARPANRVYLRLAVNAGSIDEADDQQGLAHFLEHMAFNGSAHFKPGEFISYFESVGARLGPHVNAQTGFEETIYMLNLPADRPDVVARGLTALADVAGGLTLDPEQVDKERGVVIEEWRGSLGAGTRVRDKQLPVIFRGSRFAERLPIGKPEILRTAPASRLRAFYDTFYRPDRMAFVAVGDTDVAALEQAIRTTFSGLTARGATPPPRQDAIPLERETLVSVVADPEVQRSSVSILRKRPRERQDRGVDYRRALVDRLVQQMLDERFEELSRRPDARILGAGGGDDELSRTTAAFTLGASVADGRLRDGLTTLVVESRRVRQYGFGPSELDRAKKQLAAFYAQAYAERDKTESDSFAREYVSHYLDGEPSPGIAVEYQIANTVLPGVTGEEVAASATRLMEPESRVVLAVAPQKPDVPVPSEADLRASLADANAVAVTPWTDTAATRALMEQVPAPAAIVTRRERADLGLTIVRFANGVEAWLKPTDFKNDEVVFTMYSRGGLSLAAPADFTNASMATTYVGLSGAGGLKALDIQKILAGRLAGASPFISLFTQGVSGSSTPADLEVALQLLHQQVVAPGDDPDAFALLRRQLEAAVANRQQNPQALFGDKVGEVTTSGHYTAQPLTLERIASLDRAKMMAFYKARFAHAADFTFFMVGAFKVEDAIPLLARYVGTLPSTGEPSSANEDIGIKFPESPVRAEVKAGREPRGQALIAFYADPPPDPVEQERVLGAADLLEIALRDILREDLGQTYSVGVAVVQRLPSRGTGYTNVRFGADPVNIGPMIDRVMQEVRRLQTEAPSADLTTRVKESARRNYEIALRQNGYWLGRLQTTHLLGQDPGIILTRPARIDALSPDTIKDALVHYFPLDRTAVVTLVPATTPQP
jgi:zinc protease